MDYYLLLLPQAVVGLVDAISFMVVGPSVVFYVYSIGGTKEDYGIVLAAFSFASFLFKPVYGQWCDSLGYKFRAPYMASLSAACMGGLVYFGASLLTGRLAVYALIASRFLGGMGGANSTLSFTYVAQVIPHEKMTEFTTLFSMMRILGMTLAPFVNVLLKDVNATMYGFALTPLNTVGLFLAASNALSLVIAYWKLEEPPESTKPGPSPVGTTKKEIWQTSWTLAIILPIINIFWMNANFQFLETGLAPSAADLLGWGPVNISTAFAANSIIMFFLILCTFSLSKMGVKDSTLMYFGLIQSVIGYGSLYFLWKRGVNMWVFILPFLLSTSAFPFLGAPTRSMFTRAIDKDPVLKQHQGTMQAILSMAASVAGFSAPSLITAFVLRTSDEVEASSDHRVYTSAALIAPIGSALLLLGFLYVERSTKEESDEEVTENSSLLQGTELSDSSESSKFHPRTVAYRRQSVTLMGVSQVSFNEEKPSRSASWAL